MDSLLTASALRSRVGRQTQIFVLEYFRVLKQEYFRIKSRSLETKAKIIHTLHHLETVVEEEIRNLENTFAEIKNYLDFFLNKYNELLNKYGSGNSKIFVQFYKHVKAEVKAFVHKLSVYLINFEMFQELKDLYESYLRLLRYLNVEGIGETYLTTFKR